MAKTKEENRVYELEMNNDVNFVRQRDWFDPQEHPEAHVTLIGAGGIGSPTALAMTKLGMPSMTIIDFDEIEAHNIPNQMYTMAHAGESKVQALAAMCEAFGATDVTTLEGKGEDFPEAYHGVVITGLDNMDARYSVWDQVKANKETVEFFIDARMGGQQMVIYAFDPNDEQAVEYYEMFGLFPQEEAVEAPCTAQAVIDVSFTIASMITRATRKYLAHKGQLKKLNERLDLEPDDELALEQADWVTETEKVKNTFAKEVPMVMQFDQETLAIEGV